MTSAETPSVDELGPIDVLVVAFPGNEFRGEIAPAIGELVANGTVLIIDLVFVKKDADGALEAVELSELSPDEGSGFDDVDGEVGELLTDEDLALAAEALEPNSSAALLVWENVWARRVATAIRAAGGEVIMNERIPHEVVAAAVGSADDGESLGGRRRVGTTRDRTRGPAGADRHRGPDGRGGRDGDGGIGGHDAALAGQGGRPGPDAGLRGTAAPGRAVGRGGGPGRGAAARCPGRGTRPGRT
ncbi:MAG: DUF6325 family protein, partial [Acidimicrobiales bacterium]